MFKKVTISKTRGFKQKPYLERLTSAKAIDLRDNSTFIDMENGYGKIVPIDREKLV